ncbi:butyrophilin-like protein 8 [Macrotis lagotis]|uniref:butyrophilin-like protein 8 n=1 Tax=Macrotis lagotis TaxID=92651 RepID=UPI003D69D2CC
MASFSKVLLNRPRDMLNYPTFQCPSQVFHLYEYCFLFLSALSLIRLGSGQFQLIGPDDHIQALAGEDVVFSCHVSPKMNLEDMEVRFFRNHFSSVLLLYKDGKEVKEKQMQEYQGRTELMQDAIIEGTVSLKLKNIIPSDKALYGCWFSSKTFYQQYTWELQVAALGSTPIISFEGYRDGEILLLCQSVGWLPEPSVQWRQDPGHLLTKHTVEQDDNGFFFIKTNLSINEHSNKNISCLILNHVLKQEKESRVHIAEWMEATKHSVRITLDPDTAHPRLHVSEDKQLVTHEDKDLPVMKTEKRFKFPCVVTLQRFSSDDHYWEVEVGEMKSWYIGVCWSGVNREEKNIPFFSKGYWIMGLMNDYEYFIFKSKIKALSLLVQPRRIGVFLRFKAREVSFFNVTGRSHIYTFTNCHFQENDFYYPYFSPVRSGWKEHSIPMSISPVVPLEDDISQAILLSS